MSGSGISWAICKSASCSRQITMPAPHHSVFLQAGHPSCHPTNNIKSLKALKLKCICVVKERSPTLPLSFSREIRSSHFFFCFLRPLLPLASLWDKWYRLLWAVDALPVRNVPDIQFWFARYPVVFF